MADARIVWVRGERRSGPMELIGVLEVRADGTSGAALAERTEIDGRCHIRLARQAWDRKDALETRWWSLVLDENHKAFTVRNGSCGDPVTAADVPRIIKALEDLDLVGPETMIALDKGIPVFPRRPPTRSPGE